MQTFRRQHHMLCLPPCPVILENLSSRIRKGHHEDRKQLSAQRTFRGLDEPENRGRMQIATAEKMGSFCLKYLSYSIF